MLRLSLHDSYELHAFRCPLSERSIETFPLTRYLSGVPDFFDRNKILSGGDLSHYQVPHILFWIMYLL